MAASVCPRGWNCPANLCAPCANHNAEDATSLATLTNSPTGFANCLAGLANSLAQAANPMETPVFQGFLVTRKNLRKS